MKKISSLSFFEYVLVLPAVNLIHFLILQTFLIFKVCIKGHSSSYSPNPAPLHKTGELDFPKMAVIGR